MKGEKCIKFLALFITLLVGLGISSKDTNALLHEFDGLTYGSYEIPTPLYNSQTHEWYFDWQYDGNSTFLGGGPPVIEFKGDAFTDYEKNITFTNTSFSQFTHPIYFDGQCHYAGQNSLHSLFNVSGDENSRVLGPSSYSLIISYPEITGTYDDINCQPFNEYGSTGVPSFDWDSTFTGLGGSNRIGCNDINNTGNNLSTCSQLPEGTYIEREIKPFAYSANGLYLHSHAIDTDTGKHYNYTFSLKDLYNKPIHRFSYLKIPLGVWSDYFINPENLYYGRQVSVSGIFEFDGSFEWHSNIENTGTFSYKFSGLPINSPTYELHEQEIICTANNRSVPDLGVNWLEYSCDGTLDYDYLFITDNRLEISNQDNYVWVTDSDWRFATVEYVTDNDRTPGDSFNDNIQGGSSHIVGQITPEDFDDSNVDWLTSLKNLFSFGFINPFRPLFDLFSNNDSCVNIPTLAGMLHSEETQVCPWFSSSTRNIVTPVLGISSMMLVFGFAVRWLGARSGNFIEDSGEHDSGGLRIQSKYRRNK